MSGEELKELITKRGQIKGRLTRFQTFFDNPQNKENVAELKLRLQKTENCWSEFEAVQEQVELLDISTTNHDLERESFETQFFSLVSKVTEHIESRSQANATPTISANNISSNNGCNSHHSIPVKLPTINLPKFSGRYEDWVSFFDTFIALIHENEGLSEVQKLHYLKASLTSDAAKILNNLDLSATNYHIAVSLLKEKYHNTRLIVQNHIKALYNIQPVYKDNPSTLEQLVNTVETNLRALKALGQNIESWDQLIIHLITTKLDQITHKDWELATTPNELPTLKELLEFLQKRCQVLKNIQQQTHNRTLAPRNDTKAPFYKGPHNKNTFKTMAHVTKPELHCNYCNGKHLTYYCTALQSAKHTQRIEVLNKNNVCINCLTKGHKVGNCFSRGCKTCGKKHHTILHIGQLNSTSTSNSQPAQAETQSTTSAVQTADTVITGSVKNSSNILLSTALVDVVGPHGHTLTCRAFLDTGSQSSFITESVCQKLGLRKNNTSLMVTGVGENSTHISHKTNAIFKSKHTNYQAEGEFFILQKITGVLPSNRLNLSSWNIPKYVKLADPCFYEPNKIDILLGQEFFFDILTDGKITNKNIPTLQNTKLGWIVGGRTDGIPQNKTSCHLNILENLDASLERFWKIEEPPTKMSLGGTDKKCEELYSTTTRRAHDGRYIVQMPCKGDPLELGASRAAAEKRFKQLEKRFVRKTSLHEQYCEFMKEYEDLGHMEKYENINTTPEYYLPHHPVIKESSSTTKTRVVFDASAKTSTSKGLNDMLMVGPTIQDDLISILLRFRTHQYVMSADIEKMYRQIWVCPSQRNLLKIIWRSNASEDLHTFRLNTVTYGTACAPYLATRTLHQLANDECNNYPEAAETIKHDFYVDDLLTGANTIEEAKMVQKQLIESLAKGGFNLRKWNSNSNQILQDLPDELKERRPQQVSIEENATVKTLGLWWDASHDHFQFKYSPPEKGASSHLTKRTMLSNIARLFDPLGLVSPIIVKSKLLLQELWKLQLGWDEDPPAYIHTQWDQLQLNLQEIGQLRIPRHATQASGNIELHGFSDASEKAYGAVIYIRDIKNNVTTSKILCAKSRVAPVRSISLPRLELCGALLLAELVEYVKSALKLQVTRSVYWTDSSVVLSWIAAHASRWKTFVANRIGKIHELTKPEDWRHVKSQENPADLLSRGVAATDLIDSNLWWSGPNWLVNKESSWPKTILKHEERSMTEEKKMKKTEVSAATMNEENTSLNKLINKCSTLQHLQRTMAYVLRFKNNCQNSQNKLTGALSPDELSSSLKHLIKHEQCKFLSKDIQLLKSKEEVGKKSKLVTLKPFINCDGLICVGGRLQHSQVSNQQKHPIILPAESHLTMLIIRNMHTTQLHVGPQGLLAALRQQYWPMNARNITRKIVHQCVKCFKAKPRWNQPQMGELPSYRTTPARPFTNTGIDYCGPVYIKSGLMKNSKIVKGYIVIFVCLATKAIHLELATDMTSETFLATLKRFVARRGICKNIFTDNGTNFVGAKNELHELRRLLQRSKNNIINKTSALKINWHFIPPKAPNFGGLWEAGVKSVKYHLKRVIGNANLKFEQFNTTLTSIEACLNSRPLTPLSTDPSDPMPLTPGHFLTGDALTALPEPDYTTTAVNKLSHWQRVQQLTQHFWKRWSTEYLTQLQQRQKWTSGAVVDIRPGQVVIVREDNLPPLKWVTAVVENIHPGGDGHIRVATVRTKNGTMKRAVSRLCVLPLPTDT